MLTVNSDLSGHPYWLKIQIVVLVGQYGPAKNQDIM